MRHIGGFRFSMELKFQSSMLLVVAFMDRRLHLGVLGLMVQFRLQRGA